MIQIKNYFLKQKIMTKVLISLLPILIFSIYLFGWRVLTVLAVVTAAGILSEYGMMWLINGSKAKVSEALFVTCLLFTLTLPPTVPYWIAVVGIVFGIVFGKGVFGGFGKNIFNPALVGRSLIFISFPAYMTISWTEPFQGFPGGFAQFIRGYETDAVSAATPIGIIASGETVPWLDLISGRVAGSLGETSAILILAAAVYLLVTKTASWRIMLSCMISFSVFSLILFLTSQTPANPLYSLLSGSFLFAAVFMATDPISGPKQDFSRYIYGALIGLLVVVIRNYSLFAEGTTFAVLIANAFVPLLDRHVRTWKARKQVST